MQLDAHHQAGPFLRAGVARRASEGPLDFAARVAIQRPQLGTDVHRITGMYVALRYGDNDSPMRAFRHAVSAFRAR